MHSSCISAYRCLTQVLNWKVMFDKQIFGYVFLSFSLILLSSSIFALRMRLVALSRLRATCGLTHPSSLQALLRSVSSSHSSPFSFGQIICFQGHNWEVRKGHAWLWFSNPDATSQLWLVGSCLSQPWQLHIEPHQTFNLPWGIIWICHRWRDRWVFISPLKVLLLVNALLSAKQLCAAVWSNLTVNCLAPPPPPSSLTTAREVKFV